MMLWKIFAGLIFFWIFVALLCGALTNLFLGSNVTTVASILLAPETPAYTNPVGGISATYTVTQSYLGAFWQAMWLDFPVLFNGEFAIVRILLLTIIMGVLVSLVVGSIRGA